MNHQTITETVPLQIERGYFFLNLPTQMQFFSLSILVFGLCSALPMIPGASGAEAAAEKALGRVVSTSTKSLAPIPQNLLSARIPSSLPAVEMPTRLQGAVKPYLAVSPEVAANSKVNANAVSPTSLLSQGVTPSSQTLAKSLNADQLNPTRKYVDAPHISHYVKATGDFTPSQVEFMREELHMHDDMIRNMDPKELMRLMSLKVNRLPVPKRNYVDAPHISDYVKATGDFTAEQVKYMREELHMYDDMIRNMDPKELERLMSLKVKPPPIPRRRSLTRMSNEIPELVSPPFSPGRPIRSVPEVEALDPAASSLSFYRNVRK